jgi:ABC-type branched-subunit amino acid transport system ATPase component/ABC-type branched-subunit amino acid transport system permease subunit
VAIALAGYFVPQWIWGWQVPASQILLGVIIGSLTALTSFGLALVYRSNRVINFAQADIGAVPASLAIGLVTVWGWSFWVSIPLALATAVVLGSVVEFVVIRRFAKAPRLIVMVVTIGVAQLLAGLGTAIPFWMGSKALVQQLPAPFDLNLTMGGYVFHAPEVLAVVTTLVAIAGLFSFLRFTNMGIALRASSERADRAGLLGINVGLTHNVAWIISAVLAAITLIFRAAIIGLPLGSVLGPSILLRALTAAVIGRMDRFGVMFVAACGLGVVEALIIWNTGSATLVDPVMFVIVVGALLLQRRSKESRVEDQGVSSWADTAAVRPIPRELAGLPEVRWTFRGLRVIIGIALIALPFVLDIRDTNLASAVAIYAVIAISLVILTGWSGQISLGQVAFVAIGAAATSAANVHWGLDPAASFLLAGMIGAGAAVIIGLPALRIRGLFLAVTTLAFAVATPSFLLNRDESLFGIRFTYLPDPVLDQIRRLPQWTPFGHVQIGTERQYYFLALVALGLVLLAVRGLQRLRTARDLIAVRENERNALAFRLSPATAQLLAFAVSGFFASFAGGVLALQQQALGSAIFAPTESIRVLTMVVVGGLGSVPGAILGAVFLQSTVWFQDSIPTQYQFLFQFATSGIGLILVLWLLPGGLGSLIYSARDWFLRRIARKRGLPVPSLIADSGRDPELLTGEQARPATAPDRGERPVRGPTFLRRLPHRKVPDVNYFSYSDLALSGGEPNLLSLRSVDVSYGPVQVLFGVNLELREGETVALLGTNGAGKSTVLRAISGLVGPKHGSISHNGVDISGMAPHRIAALGIGQVPGGRGVFPSLTVAENLRLGLWMRRRDREYCSHALASVLEMFPVLQDRLSSPAASLSGGQQQMLTLAMAVATEPKLLMIDELSLGLAPAVVADLLEVVKSLRERGTTIIVVEQSVNVALAIADKAFFMEKGAVRFHGRTAELRERPDLLRSIFLEGAAVSDEGVPARPPTRPVAIATAAAEDGHPKRVVLEARGLTKRFAGINAVDGVSFDLHEGEILGIIGPNGAGKTTLFDLISGFVQPDDGTLRFDEHDITHMRPQRRARLGLSRSFQDARLFGGLTVHQAVSVAIDRPLRVYDPIAEMVRFPSVVRAVHRVGKRADELISSMGLDDYRDKFVSDLSTGSRRVVDLACQVGVDPRVILFDEPTSGIAQREAEALGPLLLRIRDLTGASILLIEHDMAVVTAVSDRILACDLGQVVVEGDCETVLSDPRVVASYLGSTRETIERSDLVRADLVPSEPAS